MKRKRSKSKKQRRRELVARILAVICFVFIIFLVGLIIFAEKKLSYLVLGGLGESFSTKIYSTPKTIYLGDSYTSDGIIRRIKRLRYTKTDSPPLSSGQYYLDETSLTVSLRGFKSPLLSQSPQEIEFLFNSDGIEMIRDINGFELEEISLEPELIKELSGQHKVKRDPVEYEEFSPYLIHAVVSVEDGRFFSHWGIDPVGLLRALYHNLFKRRGLQGGSTITQQLAKNLFLNPKRTLRRKMAEAWLALYLELRFSKKKILTLYLNHIYMGQDGNTSIAGLGAASRFYFGKKPKDLTLAECALLAGIIQSPYRYNPLVREQKAKKRRDFVLKRMQDENYISHPELVEAQSQEIDVSGRMTSTKTNEFDYYVAEVVRRMLPVYGEDALFRYGLKIYTAIDPLYQSYAYQAVKDGKYQAAINVIDPKTGHVLASVGGRNFQKSQFNRATQARRQPGSAFKPFVFGAALEKGYTPASPLSDEKIIYLEGEEDEWRPENFNDIYLGTVTIRQALTFSINMATLDLIQQVGPNSVIKFAERMGIESELKRDLAIGLGAYEVTALELVAAYAPFVNGGFRITPQFVLSVMDSENEILELNVRGTESVLDPSISFLMTSMLKSVVTDGTAKNLAGWGWTYPAAGKTGTTNEGRDAWFVGYTSNLLAGVWFGDDKARSIQASGSGNAVPIWASFMKKVYRDFPPPPFPESEGIVKIKIDPLSHKRGRSGCPQKIEEYFISGTEPKEYCQLHDGGIKGWFKRLFD